MTAVPASIVQSGAAYQQTPPAPGRGARARAEALSGYLMLSPAALLFIVFFVGPVIAAIALSFFNWDVLQAPTFAGLGNYRILIHDSIARTAMLNTVEFTVLTVVAHLVLGMALALIVNRLASRALQYFLRTALFFPLLVSWAACSLLWKYALDPNFGFFNFYLEKFGISPPDWLLDPHWALLSLVFIDIWRSLGYTFVILLAGLQTVPAYLYDSARVDGANRLQQFRNVTIPMMSPTLLFAVIISFVGAFQIFDPMYIMTQGGPGNATLSIVQYDYYMAFRDFRMGYACALALVIAAVIMTVSLVQLRLSRLWVHYER